MKIALKNSPLVGLAILSLLFLSSCEVIDTLTPGMDLLTQEAVADAGDTDGGQIDGGEVDGGGDDGGIDGGGGPLEEPVDCGDAVPCGMVLHNPDLPCVAIDGGICVDGCCEPGECRGPNEDFYLALGHDGCPPHGQGEVDSNGCCVRGRSADAPGHFCPDGPRCRGDHPSGFDLPCVAINGGECVDGCCEPGLCKGPTCEFLEAMGDGCDGICDSNDCCIPDGGGDDGIDGGGGDDGVDGGDDGGSDDGGGTAVSI